MNTKNFKCFQIVYEEKNITSAANKLFLSPQGLSKIIKALEEECGTALFVRTKEGLIPTESGKIFYEKSKEVTKNLNEMFSQIQAQGSKDKRFKIGFSLGTIRVVNIANLRKVMEAYPEISGSWRERVNAEVRHQVANGDIDFGIVVGIPKDKGLKAVRLCSLEVVLYVYNGHRLWNAEEVSLSDLRDEQIISMNENYHIYHDFVNACHIEDFNPSIIAKVGEGESIYTLVKNKVGIGISPRFLKEDASVRAIKIKDAYSWDIYGIYREESPDIELAQKLIQAISEA
jgi:DNA-binding transcriptional LysR family regulator